MHDLIREHYDALRSFCLYLCRGRSADAEDLLHDTITLALAAASKYDPNRGPFQPWIQAIAYRRFLSLCRRCRPGQLGPTGRDVPATGDPDRVVQTENRERWAAALDGLPPRERSVIDLFLKGLPQKTIARRLKISDGAVSVRLEKARDRLRAAFGGRNPFGW